MKNGARGFLAAICISTASTAALADLPQPGLWAISTEVNGKPGRGIQIDRQGSNLLVVSYYGYRNDGSATFAQAVGKVADDDKTFTADLKEYKNGPAIGGAVTSGELATLIGTLQMEFDTATSGSISLPGEKKQAFSRFTFEDLRHRLNANFYVTRVALHDTVFTTAQGTSTFKQSGDQLEFTLNDQHEKCSFKGDLTPHGDGFTSMGRNTCSDSLAPEDMFYKLEDLKVDNLGFLTGTLYISLTQDFTGVRAVKLFGTCDRGRDDVNITMPGEGGRCTKSSLEFPLSNF